MGDLKARIAKFARRAGHDHIWDYVRAHPGVPLSQIARTMRDVAPIDILWLMIEHCLQNGAFAELVCDWLARDLQDEHQQGRSKRTELYRVADCFWIGGSLRDPHRKLASAMGPALRRRRPPAGWLPESGSDPYIVGAYEAALTSLTAEQRRMIERGESVPDPGDAYWSKLEPVRETIDFGCGTAQFRKQFARARPELRHLYATHLCYLEVCNGGFDQFFGNFSGIVAPETVAGFHAIGMSRCAELVAKAVRRLGAPYPRSQRTREARLDTLRPRFRKLDDAFFAAIEEEAGGFLVAADRYSRTFDGSS
jgi:hypothetical protein